MSVDEQSSSKSSLPSLSPDREIHDQPKIQQDYGTTHEKFSARSVEPVPSYRATCG